MIYSSQETIAGDHTGSLALSIKGFDSECLLGHFWCSLNAVSSQQISQVTQCQRPSAGLTDGRARTTNMPWFSANNLLFTARTDWKPHRRTCLIA